MTDGAGPDGGPGRKTEADEAGGSHEAAGSASPHGSRQEWSSGPATGQGPDLGQLARDWISLWQSELSAIAVDREAQETWQAMLALWAGAAGAMLHAMPRAGSTAAPSPPSSARAGEPAGHDAQGARRAARRAGAEPATGTAAAAAAPDPRDAEIERLARHVAELETRLAGLERGDRRGPARQPRKRKR
ncbi:MAG: hypothetical protein P4L71_19150 [Acetobacteraceae bacterium]|nr:hypothetical protein [Acetobacteraceae bacterium]